MIQKKPKLTAEDLFLEAWNEYGYPGSDITREYRFHDTRRWRFDFAFPSRKIAVEIDGRGRHQTVAGVRGDCEKSNTALLMGWGIFRIPTSEVKRHDALRDFVEQICSLLETREDYSVKEEIHPRVGKLQEVPTPPKRPPPRSIPGNHPSGSIDVW